ncbi:toll/interleukin-1 receptor domain-containing protein [Streptomyces rochei]|uniref:toll/interleukin-1 receptor domain-containing protein n=1 Tax=Streptomyces rochei TaxID=1928 RepID=UPI0036FB8D79
MSHAGADRAWAEWVAWQLLDAGLQVELDFWDWGAGDNFILKMNAALERGRFLALFSPVYFEPERFTTPEWTAVMAMGEKITQLRVAETVVPAILRSLISRDVFGIGEEQARQGARGMGNESSVAGTLHEQNGVGNEDCLVVLVRDDVELVQGVHVGQINHTCPAGQRVQG